MNTCAHCCNEFIPKPIEGHFCSRRCFALDQKEKSSEAENTTTGNGLFKVIQGGLQKLDHGLAEDEMVA